MFQRRQHDGRSKLYNDNLGSETRDLSVIVGYLLVYQSYGSFLLFERRQHNSK